MKRIVNVLGKLSCGKRAFAVFVLCATTAMALPAQTFTTLFTFDGADGTSPSALVQATNGDFYGTTSEGGASNATQLLHSWSQGDQAALEQLTPLVYDHLHRMAQHYMAQEHPARPSKPPPWSTKRVPAAVGRLPAPRRPHHYSLPRPFALYP